MNSGMIMAKGVIAEIRKALIKQGISENAAASMTSNNANHVHHIWDCVLSYVAEVAKETKKQVDLGKPEDFSTLIMVMKSFKRVPANRLKRKVSTETWVPPKVARLDNQVKSEVKCEECEVQKGEESRDKGLKLLVQAMDIIEEGDRLIAESPLLAELLSDSHW